MNHYNKLNDYHEKLSHYIEEITGTGFLAYRDIPYLIQHYSNGGIRALDFGCGAGRSTRFLKKIGLSVDGVDIDNDMIEQANKIDADISYFLIKNQTDLGKLPAYDIIFNCFVLFEIGNKSDLIAYLFALRKKLNSGGVCISVVNSEFLFTRNWLSCFNDFKQNKSLKSGDIAKIQLPQQGNIELYDYYWLESDYIHFFEQAGFESIHLHKPVGLKNDPYAWKDELKFPPYTIYICK